MKIYSLYSLSQNTILSFKIFSEIQIKIIKIAAVAFVILGALTFAAGLWETLKSLKNEVALNQILASGDMPQLLAFLQHYKGKVEHLNLNKIFFMHDEVLRALISLCPHLKTLIIENCSQITDQGLEYLQGLPSLTHLRLSKKCDQISDAGLEKLQKLSKLTQLRLGNCRNITRQGLEYLTSLNALNTLELEDGYSIGGTDLEIIAKFPNLRVLHLESFSQITDGDLKALTSLTQLMSLNLTGCSQITDQGLYTLSQACQDISFLNLSRCSNISNTAPEFLSNFKVLKDLDLSYCPLIDDKSIDNFIDSKESNAREILKNLNLSYCHQINDKALESLQKLTALKQFNLSNADQITDDGS